MMAYDVFARFYDQLTGDIDYGGRAEYYRQLFARHNMQPSLVADLACGTGSLTFALAKAGYEVIGVDRSQGMLCAAENKKDACGDQETIFICQDICALDLYGTVDAAICHLDGINHLMTQTAVRTAFERVSLFLNEGGLFVFDLNTPYKMAEILGNNTFVYDYDDIYCVWQNEYNAKRMACSFDLTFFERSGGIYRRYGEHFAEKAYKLETVKALLKTSGLNAEAEYDGFSFEPVRENSERTIFVARKV